MFDMCEYYDTKYNTEPERRPETYKTCSEEILQDLWRYYRVRGEYSGSPSFAAWSYIKIGESGDSANLEAPPARYNHATAYVYKENENEQMPAYEVDGATADEIMMRKFMYIYGGFSYDCHTACQDIWLYEIPYMAKNVPPVIAGKQNTGNYWQNLTKSDGGPGRRYKVSMVAYQRKQGLESDRDIDLIYMFGGIKIINPTDEIQLSEAEKGYVLDIPTYTSFLYMNDMWAFDVYQNQWEQVAVYGISEITRFLYLWNGTKVRLDVATKDRLYEDTNNTIKNQSSEYPEENERIGLRLP